MFVLTSSFSRRIGPWCRYDLISHYIIVIFTVEARSDSMEEGRMEEEGHVPQPTAVSRNITLMKGTKDTEDLLECNMV